MHSKNSLWGFWEMACSMSMMSTPVLLDLARFRPLARQTRVSKMNSLMVSY